MTVERNDGDAMLTAYALLRRHAPAHLRAEIASLEVLYFRGSPGNERLDYTIARQIEGTGNVVSGLGKHGLANELWALAAALRRGDRGLGAGL